MFVRPDLMPRRIRITDIRIERLHDISPDDCLREGVRYDGNGTYYVPGLTYRIHRCYSLWNSNPWVFVYTFQLIKKI